MNGKLVPLLSTLGLSALLALAPTSLRAAVPPPNGPGSALSFDGVDDHLTAAPSTLPVGNSSYTIEAWIKPNAMHVGAIAAWGNYGVNNQVNAFILTPTGLANYWWGNDLTATTASLAGAWHHVAATFDGSTRRILLDGAVIASDTPVGHNATPNNFRIGLANTGQYFNGHMDAVRIWNVDRTPAQILEAMRRQLFGNESGLTADYRLDENSGPSAFDATENSANTATLVNGPTWVPSTVAPFAPPLTTLAASAVVATSATLNGEVDGRTSLNTFEAYFQWGTTPSLGNELRLGFIVSGGAVPQNFSLPLTGLASGTTYYFRAAAMNGNGPSYGATFTVTPHLPGMLTVRNNNDSGADSLRQVIQGAVPGDTVDFAPHVTGNILLTSGELSISTDLIIQGPDARRLTVSASGASRVFDISSGRVRISGLTIADGAVIGAPGNDGALPDGSGADGETVCGGAIHNRGQLTLVNCVLHGHRAEAGSGGAGSPSSPSSAAGYGGYGGSAFGGAICNENSLELFNCALFDNESVGGTGGRGGGGFASGGGRGGGLAGAARGGALYCAPGAWCEVVQCTFTRNQATGGRGGDGGSGSLLGGDGGNGEWADGGAVASEGICQALSCTFSGNDSVANAGGSGGTSPNLPGLTGRPGTARGGGVFVAFGHLPATSRMEVRNNIIAGNSATLGPDVFDETGGIHPGALFSFGANLIGIPDGSSGWVSFPFHDTVGSGGNPIDPRLGALHENGGSTPTMSPAQGSRARDTGYEFGLTTDQRGALRSLDIPTIANFNSPAGTDIGACESGTGLRILSVSGSGSTKEIQFQSEAGVLCRLQRADEIDSGNWASVGSAILGTGNVMSRLDLGPLPATRFYRVIAVP